MFEKNDSIPVMRNDIIKSKFLYLESPHFLNNTCFISTKDFYQAVYRNDNNFWMDFDKYLKFQMDSKIKGKEYKIEEFTGKMSKLFQGSIVNYFKFYSRCNTV